jgi:hypothetical protein
VNDKLELRAQRDEVRRRKVEIEDTLEDLTGKLNGYLDAQLRLSVELARIERQLRGEGWNLQA